MGPIGLDLNKYPFTQIDISKKISFLFIGRLIREKGIFEFIKAAEIINKEFPKIKFIILGNSENKNNPGYLGINNFSSLLEKDYFIWKRNTNVVPWIKTCSIFVLPSYREGFPRSTQEAMAVGRAIITTNVPGCRETVIQNKNGLLIPPCDINSLANAMRYFIINHHQIEIMGKESYLIAEKHFSSEIFNNKIIKLILS